MAGKKRLSGPYWRKTWDFIAPYIYQGSVLFSIVAYPKDGSNQEIHTHVFHITSFSRQIFY